MIDKTAISQRFLSFHSGKSRSDVGRIYGVSRTYVTDWATKGTVPWDKLKYLSDSLAISWDWLIDGVEPKESMKQAKRPKSLKPKFASARINRRFLSLFPGMTQTDIAEVVGSSISSVNDWKKNRSQVPWQKLAEAVATFGVRWDWLIDGLEPKYRSQAGGGEG